MNWPHGYRILPCVADIPNKRKRSWRDTASPAAPMAWCAYRIHHIDRTGKVILNAAIPVVEIWDLTPTPLDMLVGFSHEKSGRRQSISGAGHRRPGLLWTADRRAAQRQSRLCSVLSTPRHSCRTAGRCPFRHRFRWGAKRLPAFDEGTFDVIVCSSDTRNRGDDGGGKPVCASRMI